MWQQRRTYQRDEINKKIKQTKRPARGRPFQQTQLELRSVLQDRARIVVAELVVHANRNQVDVLTDAVAREVAETHGAILQEDVVVFHAHRPVRRKADFDASADRATPIGVAARVGEQGSATKGEDVVTVVDNRGTALHTGQDVVPGIADLAGKEPERVQLRAVGQAGDRADVRATEVSPVALCFDPEHPGAGLPAVAELATD